ncbi:MAG TPA: hypothetical protein VID48_03865 [Solirubrobacteraceae bacterium]|jgi:hypothetical protein
MTVMLTERGRLAALEGRAAVEGVDERLRSRVGAESIAHAHVALEALIDINDEREFQNS